MDWQNAPHAANMKEKMKVLCSKRGLLTAATGGASTTIIVTWSFCNGGVGCVNARHPQRNLKFFDFGEGTRSE